MKFQHLKHTCFKCKVSTLLATIVIFLQFQSNHTVKIWILYIIIKFNSVKQTYTFKTH